MGVLIPMAGTMTSFGGMKAAVSTPFNCTVLNDSQVKIVSTVLSDPFCLKEDKTCLQKPGSETGFLAQNLDSLLDRDF